MASAESFDFAAELEIAPDFVIVEDSETVDNSQRGACPFDNLIGVKIQIRRVRDGENDSLSAFKGGGQIMLDAQIDEAFLIMEEPCPRVAGCGIGVLIFNFEPMLEIGVVDFHVGAHLRKFADDNFRAAVTGICDVLTVTCAAEKDGGAGELFAHIAEGISCECGGVEAASVVDVDGHRRNLEYVIVEAENVFVCPVAEAAVFGEAVAADAGAGEYHIVVRRTHFYGVDDFNEVNAVAFGEDAPFIEKGQNCRAVGVFDDFGCFGFDGAVHNREREFFGVEDFAQEFFDAISWPRRCSLNRRARNREWRRHNFCRA